MLDTLSPHNIIEAITKALSAADNLYGIALIVFILLQVGIVLASLYLRPVRTMGQFFKLLLILFAALAICCMTVWLLWEFMVV